MTKILQKTIMTLSRFKNIPKKQRSYFNWDNYKKQGNFCVKRTTSVVLILLVLSITKNSGKLLSLILAKKD